MATLSAEKPIPPPGTQQLPNTTLAPLARACARKRNLPERKSGGLALLQQRMVHLSMARHILCMPPAHFLIAPCLKTPSENPRQQAAPTQGLLTQPRAVHNRSGHLEPTQSASPPSARCQRHETPGDAHGRQRVRTSARRRWVRSTGSAMATSRVAGARRARGDRHARLRAASPR